MMRKTVVLILMVLLLLFTNSTTAVANNYAWVLVNTHTYPAETSTGAPYSNDYYKRQVTVRNGFVEIMGSTPEGRLARDPQQNLHAKYTWNAPPSTISANQTVSIKFNQESISNVTGGFSSGYQSWVATGGPGQTSWSGSKTRAQFTAPDGNKYTQLDFGSSSAGSAYSAQESISVDFNFQFKGQGQQGEQWSIYVCVAGWGGSPVGQRYTYEWKQVGTSGSSTPSAGRFSDLPANHWAHNTIIEMVELGILTGFPDGTFKPNNTISRAEFASIMVKALELQSTRPGTATFSDVPTNHWAFEVVESARNYLTGYRDTRTGVLTFEPSSVAVREDVAVAIVKAQGLDKAHANLNLLTRFADQGQISPGLRDQVAIAVEYGFMQGTNIGFQPQKALTRAEACALLYRIIEQKGGKEKVTF